MSDLDSFFAKKDRKKKKKAAAASTASANKNAPVPLPLPTPVGSVAEGLEGVSISNQDNTNNINSQAASLPANNSTKKDDGWIEIEEAKTAQVNTGGRTVATLKRDPNPISNSNSNIDSDDDACGEKNKKDTSQGEAGDANVDGEKFSGWKEGDEGEKEEAAPEPEEEKPRVFRPRTWKAAGPDVKSAQQFPSLADAAKANAPEVPQSMKAAAMIAPKSNTNSNSTMNSNPNKLTSSLTSSAGRPRFINSKKK